MSSNEFWHSIDRNTRMANGQIVRRRYVYMHKKDNSIVGIVEAKNMREARQKLGKHSGVGFYLCAKWFNENEYALTSVHKFIHEVARAVFLHPQSKHCVRR